MNTTKIREQIYEFIEMYVDTPEPKKLCSSIEDLVEELAESKVKKLALSDVSQQRELLFCDFCKEDNPHKKHEHKKMKECEGCGIITKL